MPLPFYETKHAINTATKTNTSRSHAPRGNAGSDAPASHTAHRNDTKTINCLQLNPITANNTPPLKIDVFILYNIKTKKTPPVNTDELIRIRDHMTKRGPDGKGLWVSGNKRCGLAHRRLAIIDLTEDGHQPMATQDGRFTISFNGEIYNYQALGTEMGQKNCVLKSNKSLIK
jgi:hypothetical protein